MDSRNHKAGDRRGDDRRQDSANYLGEERRQRDRRHGERRGAPRTI